MLQAAVANWWALLGRWASTGLLSWAAEQVWSNSADLDAIRLLEERTTQGDTGWVPLVAASQLATAEPSRATYQRESQKIVVNGAWLQQASETEVNIELTKELGRYLSELDAEPESRKAIENTRDSLTGSKDQQQDIEKEIEFFGNLVASAKKYQPTDAENEVKSERMIKGSGDPLEANNSSDINTHRPLTSALADYLYQQTTSNSASSEQKNDFAAAALDNSAQITTHIAEAGSLAEATSQSPLKFKHLAYIGNHEATTTERYGSTSDAAYVPWWNPESKDNGYISKLTHSGELQWRKQIADINNIITATDDDENVYTAWSRSKDYTPESRGSFIGKLNPDNGELLWTTKLDTHNYIIQDLHAVGETLYGVGHYKDTQRPVLLAVNRTDGKLLWLKEEPASDSEQFTDIQSDGTHLYISSTSRNKIAGTIHKYTLDGDVADQWQGSDRPDLKRTGTQDRYSVIVGDQLISVGTTGAEMPHHDVQWRLVSRNLETGEINWRKQWGGLQTQKNVDGIIAFKGKIYILTKRGDRVWDRPRPDSGWVRTGVGVHNNGVIQEVSLDGELGRQLFYEIPEGLTASHASHLSSDGERLYLVSGKIDRADKNSVAHLTNSENYQNDAYDEIGINQSFEVKGRAKDNYGSELSGYLTPKEDGEYVFYLSADDHAELWLSTDDSKQNLQLITKRDHATYFRDYGHAHSESIPLKAGQRYAIKALHKEGIGDSHLSVAWRPASEPAPAKGAEPIGSDYLSYDLGDNNNTDIEQSQGQGLVAKYYDNVKGGLSAAYQQIIIGNETIDSTDNIDKTGNTAPTIKLEGAQTITINQHREWFEPGWAASDAEDGDELNVSVTTPKPIDTSVPGTYEITYTVEDSGGLQNSATRTIEVLAPREGNDYYLALDGSDENDGSIDQPFATFNHAKNFLQAGDTLHLRGGWYYEQFYIDGRKTPNLWKGNDRHNPVTIKAYEGETVVLSEAPPISTTWVKDGKRWKTNVWEGSDDLGNNKRNISRLFLDDKLLTGARYPNLEKDWDQPGHNWFHTRVQTIPNPEAGEGVLTVPGLEDVDGSIKGAVFYSYWRGAREVLEHEAGSANITTPPGADDGWLMGALPLLDADREWFFDKETGDLYLQLPAGMDPNKQTIRARTDLHGIGRMDGGLAVTNGGALVFDGINLFATPFTFNASRNITFKNAELLHNDYHDLHLGGTYVGHGNFIWSSHGLRFINNEIAYNYRPAFNMGKRGDEWGGWWPTDILFENNDMHDGQIYASHNGGPFSWRTENMTAVRNTLDNYGFGGLGRIAGGSHLELNYVNNANYSWDTAGIQMNQIITHVNVQRNWIFNTKRNGIRSDGHPGGTGKIVTHNVVMGNGTGIKLKGDQHKVHHNLGFLNGADIGMWHAKFYGYTRATDSTLKDLVEAEKYQNNAYDNIKVTEGLEIEGYGQSLWGGELSGFLTPKQDGDYVFYLAADDEAELWLSTDDNTENLALIADRRQAGGYRKYTAGWDDSETLDQPGRSLSISLKAGQRYAIKALVRDGVESYKNQRSNHLSVAWRFDNEAAPVDGAEPIANEYLSYDLGDDRNHTLPIRGDGLTAKYYHDLFDTYIPSRSNARESRLGSRAYGGPERQGNYLSVAHNNAINGGFGGYPIQDPEDRSNISTRGSRQTDIRDELRDINNLDFRPKSGSSLIDSGIEIEGIHTPIAGITDGVVGSAADAGAYEYGDSHYWIAGHQTDKARFPIGATDQSTTAQPDLDLIWMEGLDSVSNLVYFGEDPEQLEFKVEQDGNIFDPTPEDGELLEPGKTYYWRIDTRTQDDTIIEGDTWSFTVDNRVKDVEIEAVLVDYQPAFDGGWYRKNFGGATKLELPPPKYDYYISKYEITNSQYAAFLNDTVGHNTNDGGAWSSSMQIKREASPGGLGGFIYTPIEGKENHPVTYVTWNNAAIFTNWLSGDAGAIYGYLGSNKYYNSRYNGPSNASAWGHGAVSLPKLEEFYKASIYNRETNTHELYSTGGNSITLDQANFKGEGDLGVGETTEVGSYPYPSYFGTYDQTGNVDEWTDHRSHKLGGSYLSTTTDNTLGYRSNLSGSWEHRFPNRGFRVVSRTANERDKDNNGQGEFYITKFEDQDHRAPQFNNPIGNLDDEELEQTDQLLNSEDDTWRLKSATLYQPYSFNIRDSVIEPQSYNFWFQLLEGPEWLKLSEDGEFTGTPTEEEHLGRFNIRYRVESDSNLFSTTTEPIELVVEPAVDASTGDDVIQTTFGSSVVFALAGDDVVQGSEQDEIFDGGRGDDTIDGGEGQDIAKYSGKQSDYSLKILENGAVEIKDLREILLDPNEIPTVEQLKSSDKYQNNAFDEAKIVNQFEFQKYGDDYGAELSGYLTPKEDGFYIFYISADDHAELWLSTDAEKENLELIAKRDMFSHFRRYTQQLGGDYSGRSHVVELKAGERYAIKALMTEAAGGDHLSVTWGLASDPAPSHGAKPIAAEFLSYDLGDEVIADIPQSQGEGLVIKYFKNLRERHNPDGVDQLMNIEHLEFADRKQAIADAIALANAEPISHEFVSSFGTSTNDDTSVYFKPSATQDLIILPWNDKINKNSVEELTKTEAYKNDDYSALVVKEKLETYGRNKDNYGVEVTGYITPTQTGNYTFYLAADDHGELWLSSDDSQENLELIVRRDTATYFRDYSKAHSESIQLQAGQRYAIKGLMKEDGGADNFSVAWAMDGDDAPANGAEPISGDVLSYDLGDSYVQADGEPPQTGEGLAFKYFDDLSTSDDRATIRAINFEGDVAWEKQLSDASQITTATDSAGHIYAAWKRQGAKPWMIGKFDANGDLLWQKELEQNDHTIRSMVVNGDTIYTAGYASQTGGPSGLIYSINAVDGSINWTETQSNYKSEFNDILTDGDALYVVGSGQGNPPNRWEDLNSHSHAYKYDFDGNQIWASKWHPKTTPNHVSRSRWAKEFSAIIFENQLISVGTAYVNTPDTNWLNYPVSRDLETGEILWHKELRDVDNTWKSGLNHDIVSHNGFAYIISNNGSQTTIFEMEKDGSLGRQLTLDSTHANNFVVANNELHLFGRTSLDTGVAENQGGDDLFLAKIDPGFDNAEVPFSGISIIPTAPRDSEGNLQTSEDGSSTSFKVKLNQAPLTDEDVEVVLTGLDPTEASFSTNRLTFNRSNWDIGQDIIIRGVADNSYDTDTRHLIQAFASNSGGYTGNENSSISLKVNNVDQVPTPSIPKLSTHSDSGGSNSDKITANNKPTFTGTAEPSHSVELFNGNQSIGSTTADAEGNWTLLLSDSAALTDGSHAIKARSVDSDYSAALSITIDTTEPSFQSTAVADAITENSGEQQSIYRAEITDASAISFALKQNNQDDSDAFTIDTATGAVTLKEDPDYDTKSTYRFSVIATDEAGNKSTQEVSLAIINIDEEAPSFESGTTAQAIEEKSGEKQVVYRAEAINQDISGITNPSISYSLSASDDSSKFSINSVNGEVTLTENPVYTNKASYSFSVIATDQAGNAKTQTISLSVLNIDELAPLFISGAEASAITENSGAGQLIYTAKASDIDTEGINNPYVTYSLAPIGDHLSFSIDADSGKVTLEADPNYDSKASYAFTVLAKDQDGNTNSQDISLAIRNIDEVAPSFNSPEIAPAIAENSGAEQIIYTAAASNNDTNDIDISNIIYSLANNGDADLFLIDAVTGEVTLKQDPDYETKNTYSFDLIATDQAGNKTSQTVSLAIKNIDETKPTFAKEEAAAESVDENSGAHQLIYTANASNNDIDGIENQSISYALAETADHGTLTIDPINGEVRLTENPDYEAKSIYNFTVIATDQAGNSGSQDVSLSINNLDEQPPSFDSAVTTADGNKVILTYSELLKLTSPHPSAFTITADGANYSVKNVAVNGSTIELTLNEVIKNDQFINISYNAPSTSISADGIQDSAGNHAASLLSTAITNLSTIDGTPPSITITSSTNQLHVDETALITFKLSESSTTFEQADLLIQGGSLSEWTQHTGSYYTAIFTPDTLGDDGLISVENQSFSDAAGNLFSSISETQNSLIIQQLNTPYNSETTNELLGSTGNKSALFIRADDLLEDSNTTNSEPLTISNLTTSWGSVTQHADQVWLFTPPANEFGRASLSFNVNDGKGGSTSASRNLWIHDQLTGEPALDVNGDGQVSLYVDGIMIIRRLIGLETCTSGFPAQTFNRYTPEQVDQLLDQSFENGHYDFDQNSKTSLYTDGILLIRHLISEGLMAGSGDLIDDASPFKLNPDGINDHINSLKPPID